MSDNGVQLSELDHIRGIRNNNPLNLKKGLQMWSGQVFGNDPTFCQFENMAYGFRAAFRTLDTYYHVHRLRTLREIINRFAPPVENETAAYVRAVATWAGVDPDKRLPSPREDGDLWPHIVGAMMAVESTPASVRCMALRADFLVGYGMYIQSIQLRCHE